jgi:hypothetical protein
MSANTDVPVLTKKRVCPTCNKTCTFEYGGEQRLPARTLTNPKLGAKCERVDENGDGYMTLWHCENCHTTITGTSK